MHGQGCNWDLWKRSFGHGACFGSAGLLLPAIRNLLWLYLASPASRSRQSRASSQILSVTLWLKLASPGLVSQNHI